MEEISPLLALYYEQKARPQILSNRVGRCAALSATALERLQRDAKPFSSKQNAKMSTTKNVTYQINGRTITFTITENKVTNEFSATIQSGGEIVAVIEGDKIKNAFENVKKRLPKFFDKDRIRHGIGKLQLF